MTVVELARKNIRQIVISLQKREGLSQNQIARESGINSGKLSAYLRDKYPGRNEVVDEALQRWLNLRSAKAESQDFSLSAHAPNLANTQAIMATLAHAQTAADLVCLYGGAGGGKTHAVRRYREDNSQVSLITAEPAICNLSAVLRAVATAVGATPGTCAQMSEDIGDRLAGKNALLIVDEAHHLSQRIFDQLRCIYDKVNERSGDFGMAFLGNEPLFEQLTNGRAMKQIYSRLGICEMLHSPPETDGGLLLSALLGAPVSDKAAVFAANEVRKIGGYRSVIKAVRRAVLYSKKSARQLTEADVLAANQ